MDEKTFIDIVLICKGWYKDSHRDEFVAMDKYYRKYYSNDYPVTNGLIYRVFLMPAVIEAVKRQPSLVENLFHPLVTEHCGMSDFDIWLDRCVHLLAMGKGDALRLPEHDECKIVI